MFRDLIFPIVSDPILFFNSERLHITTHCERFHTAIAHGDVNEKYSYRDDKTLLLRKPLSCRDGVKTLSRQAFYYHVLFSMHLQYSEQVRIR